MSIPGRGNTLEEAGYANWAKGRPSKFDTIIGGTLCAAMSGKDGSLYDIHCGHRRPFICEISGYVYREETDSLYKLHQDNVKWSEASVACEREGGHLADVSNAEEAELIVQLLRDEESEDTDTSVLVAYVGFRYDAVGGKYLNLNGELVKNVNSVYVWDDSDKPDNNCGIVHRDGQLKSVECDGKHVYVCEIERFMRQITEIGEPAPSDDKLNTAPVDDDSPKIAN